jgi:hypothetical protein
VPGSTTGANVEARRLWTHPPAAVAPRARPRADPEPPHIHAHTHSTRRRSAQARRSQPSRRPAFVSRREKRRREAGRRKEEEQREEKRRAMPAAEAPTGVVELAGHGENEILRCIVPLPGVDRVATASKSGKVRVFAVATGALEREFDSLEGDVG